MSEYVVYGNHIVVYGKHIVVYGFSNIYQYHIIYSCVRKTYCVRIFKHISISYNI